MNDFLSSRVPVRLSILVGVAALSVVGVLAACSSDDATTSTPTTSDAGHDAATAADTGSTSANGTVKVTIKTTADVRGQGGCALFDEAGGIAGTSDLPATDPTWPGSNDVLIPAVPAGTYGVFCFIDVGGDSPMGPGPEDPVSAEPNPTVTVVAGQQATLTVTVALEADAGTDGGT